MSRITQWQKDSEFFIPNENFIALAHAIAKSIDEVPIHYNNHNEAMRYITEYFNENQWGICYDESGLSDLQWGFKDSYGSDESEYSFFEPMIPYIKKGSYIEMKDEEGYHWRWIFTGAKMKEVTPTITWIDSLTLE